MMEKIRRCGVRNLLDAYDCEIGTSIEHDWIPPHQRNGIPPVPVLPRNAGQSPKMVPMTVLLSLWTASLVACTLIATMSFRSHYKEQSEWVKHRADDDARRLLRKTKQAERLKVAIANREWLEAHMDLYILADEIRAGVVTQQTVCEWAKHWEDLLDEAGKHPHANTSTISTP
jgi:hypothetical protein